MSDKNLGKLIKLDLKNYLISDLIDITIEYIPIIIYKLYYEVNEGRTNHHHCDLGVFSSIEKAIFGFMKTIVNLDCVIVHTGIYSIQSNFTDKTYNEKEDLWNFEIKNEVEDYFELYKIQCFYLDEFDENMNEYLFEIIEFRLKSGVVTVNQFNKSLHVFIHKILNKYKPLQSFLKYINENINGKLLQDNKTKIKN
jgi:hypothetical protein